MFTKAKNRAFSITELTVVVSGLGLLATFIMPLSQRLQQRQRLDGCLANLERIGAASLTYATEDPRQQLVPLTLKEVTPLHGEGWVGMWGWRTAVPHAFGGQTATTAFPIEGGEVTVMLDSYWGQAPNPWGAAARPLNSYVQAGGGSVGNFHCPADVGFPAEEAGWESPDVPAPAIGIPCFEMLGSSYRTNSTGTVWLSGSSIARMNMSVAPRGHSSSYILVPSRVVLHSDPLFYCLVRQMTDSEPVDPITGWHGSLMADNVLYCDGAARLTEISSLQEFSAQELQDMFHCSGYSTGSFLRRGATWQMDCYPAPGALIATYTAPGSVGYSLTGTCWPFERYTVNDNPYGPGPDRGQKTQMPAPEYQQGDWVVQ
jgi:type II secretory pathway pseudopilin PulG